MKSPDRQKMCPNCDGRIPYDATQCPYCFAQQQIDAAPTKVAVSTTADPLSALYPPPYVSKSSESTEGKPFSKGSPENRGSDAALGENRGENRPAADSSSFGSILMLALGSNLFTLGVLQFFFSDQGVVHLELNASYWFLMVLIGAPLIYLGLRKLAPKNPEN